MNNRVFFLILALMLGLSSCSQAASESGPVSSTAVESVTSVSAAISESEPPEETVQSAAEEQATEVSADEETQPVSDSEPASDSDCITQSEYESFHVTVEDADEHAVGFRDFEETMHSSFLGTWFDPELKEAFRLTEDSAYVYIPYLDCYGDTACPWELIDRSEEGKCPKLSIHCFGEDGPALVYYVAGNTGDYFWCVSQGQLFYRQD